MALMACVVVGPLSQVPFLGLDQELALELLLLLILLLCEKK